MKNLFLMAVSCLRLNYSDVMNAPTYPKPCYVVSRDGIVAGTARGFLQLAEGWEAEIDFVYPDGREVWVASRFVFDWEEDAEPERAHRYFPVDPSINKQE